MRDATSGTALSHVDSGWWGEFQLDMGQTYHLAMGGFQLAITRLLHEWQIRHVRQEEQADSGQWQSEINFSLPGRDWALERISLNRSGGGLRLWPVLADKPVVIRPYHPLWLPPGESATIFVSSILSVQVQIDSPRAPFTRDIPVQLASETWMGPNTMDGELCYAEMTSARMTVESLPTRAFRAITPLLILNRGREPLNLERVSLPIPMLDLYANVDGTLWTSAVTYTRADEAASAKIEIGAAAPNQVPGALKLTPARQKPDKGVLVKAIDRLFG